VIAIRTSYAGLLNLHDDAAHMLVHIHARTQRRPVAAPRKGKHVSYCNAHTHKHTHIHTHTHTQTHNKPTCTNTNTHTYTHTFSNWWIRKMPSVSRPWEPTSFLKHVE